MATTDRMKRRDVLLAIVAICGDRQEFGRTSLQKVAYFASEGLHVDFGHRAHFYGPYSDDVETDIDALVLSGLIDESVRSLSFVGGSGHQAKRYAYVLTRDGEQRVEMLRDRYPEEYRNLESFILELERVAGGLDQSVLSPAAKTYFITKRENRGLQLGEIRSLGKQLGWNLTTPQLKRVVGVLDSLGLIDIGS